MLRAVTRNRPQLLPVGGTRRNPDAFFNKIKQCRRVATRRAGTHGLIWRGRTHLARKALPSSQLATDIVAIEPRGLKHGLVTTEALTQREFHVAFEPRPGRGKMIFAGSLARSQHGRPRTRHPYPLIGEQCPIEIVCMARDRA